METTSQTEKSGWWVAYLIVLVILYGLSRIFGPHSPLDLLLLIFNGFGLVGLWGYLTDKAIGWRQFWIAYACLLLLQIVLGLTPLLWQAIRHDFALFVLLTLAVAFCAPQWLAIWRYAFRSSHIWQLPPAAA